MGSIRNYRDALAWQKRFGSGAPGVGEEAPDFDLCDSTGENPVRLSQYRGERPVALVFGSFT